jgi:hypothetical protein
MKMTPMGFDFLARVRKSAVIFGLILLPVLSTYLGIGFGAGWVVGAAWSLLNILAITGLIESIFVPAGRNYVRIMVVFLIKFPVLYVAGFMVLRSGYFPAAALVAGFSWPFFVMSMKALGRVFLKLDEAEELHLEKNSPAH